MIIDFHAHAFPDDLASRAIPILLADSAGLYQASHDGTVTGLLEAMDDSGVDVSVVMPIVSKTSQTKKINEWSDSICSNRIISFGGICPQTDDYKRDIDFVVSLGLKGLKFHAEYQSFILDDDYMLSIYDYALSKGLILLHHAGFDPAYPPPYRSNPQRFRNVARAMRGGVVIAAHLGGQSQWDDVERYLVGEDVYFDTSMGFDYFPDDQFLRIVKDHGAEKILFATDSPWSQAGAEIAFLNGLPLSEGEKTAILGGNARRLLGIRDRIFE